jgi:xylitol oxidase
MSEIRTIASDDLWMSPAFGRDSVGIHFTWVNDIAAVTPAVSAVEDALAPFEARPHWGKLFAVSPDRVGALYDRLPDFRRLARHYDPTGTFRNAMADRYLSTHAGA